MSVNVTVSIEPELLTGEWRGIKERITITNNRKHINKIDIDKSEDNDG